MLLSVGGDVGSGPVYKQAVGAGASCRRRQVSVEASSGVLSTRRMFSRRTCIEREMLAVSAATPIWSTCGTDDTYVPGLAADA
jgi:hypothetical protein